MKKDLAIETERRAPGRTRKGSTRQAATRTSAAPIHSDWPSDEQWRIFWARQEQLMLEHGLLGPEAAEALGE